MHREDTAQAELQQVCSSMLHHSYPCHLLRWPRMGHQDTSDPVRHTPGWRFLVTRAKSTGRPSQ